MQFPFINIRPREKEWDSDEIYFCLNSDYDYIEVEKKKLCILKSTRSQKPVVRSKWIQNSSLASSLSAHKSFKATSDKKSDENKYKNMYDSHTDTLINRLSTHKINMRRKKWMKVYYAKRWQKKYIFIVCYVICAITKEFLFFLMPLNSSFLLYVDLIQ